MFMLISNAVTEWVSAPIEIKSTPVSATSFNLSIVMLPEASTLACLLMIFTKLRHNVT